METSIRSVGREGQEESKNALLRYKTSIKPAIAYGNQTWLFTQKQIEIINVIERRRAGIKII